MIFKYSHPEYFQNADIPNYCDHGGNLILYGAGINGALAAKLLEQQGVQIICFCDSDRKKWGTEFLGYQVISPEEMKSRYPDAAILVTPTSCQYLFETLPSMGYTKLFNCCSLFMEFEIEDLLLESVLPSYFTKEYLSYSIDDYLRRYSNQKIGNELKTLTIVVTERCNLRCKECMSFIPYYKDPKDCDWDVMNQAIDRLLHLERFSLIEVEGGEAFLHRGLPDLLNKLCASAHVEQIYPITNGTILPSPELLNSLKSRKIIVRISDYGKYSPKLNALTALFEQENVQYAIMRQRWLKCAEIRNNRKSPVELHELFSNCCKSVGHPFLFHGRLYKCQFATHAERLGAIPRFEEDSVDLTDLNCSPGELKQKLDAFYTNRAYIQACQYCNGRTYATEPVPIAEQWKGPVPPLTAILD